MLSVSTRKEVDNTFILISISVLAGIPDERMGEEVGAFVRLKDGTKTLTRSVVRKFCEGRLAHFKIPRYVVIVDEFPRTLSGKIQKYKFLDVFGTKFLQE
jgi:acyl-CoA synthetase (AMP-forming)/AMP-acid ligase II